MAILTIPEEARELTDVAEIAAYLARYGMTYERWDASQPLADDASDEEILAAYAHAIDQLKARAGYVTADVINVVPETPGLDAMLNKFNKEHTHAEDEVRFIVKGRGVFHIHPKDIGGDDAEVFAIETGPGDLITVPRGTRHWFNLCVERNIRAIRLFQDSAGWTPEYAHGGVHDRYAPVCWGPSYLPEGATSVEGLDLGVATT